MDKNDLLQILNSGSFEFTGEEIQKIMDEELDKNPDEMDTDLIDLCLDALDGKFGKSKLDKSENQPKKKPKRTIKKLLLIAAIIATLTAAVMITSAENSDSYVSSQIVQFCKDHFNVDLRKGSTNATEYSQKSENLIDILERKGIENIILPKEILRLKYSESDVEIDKYEEHDFIIIENKDKSSGIVYKINIFKTYSEKFLLPGGDSVTGLYENIEQINIDGMDIIIFGNDYRTCIKYLDGLTDYEIILANCTFEQAVNIASEF